MVFVGSRLAMTHKHPRQRCLQLIGDRIWNIAQWNRGVLNNDDSSVTWGGGSEIKNFWRDSACPAHLL
jgi:hypothetical protein